ncbi:propionyl-CoA carboxylase beta subunit, partial [Rhodococcus opacus M213]
KDLLSYLPSNNQAAAPRMLPTDPITGSIDDSLTAEDLELDTLIPDSANQPYDMHEVIRRILDDDEFLEVQAERAG